MVKSSKNTYILIQSLTGKILTFGINSNLSSNETFQILFHQKYKVNKKKYRIIFEKKYICFGHLDFFF